MAPYDSEEEVEDEEVYSVEDRYILDMFGTYYQTYGGGPAGGYFLSNGRWYEVHYELWTTWTMKSCKPMKYTPENWREGIVASIK
jgi:hypothetical protein